MERGCRVHDWTVMIVDYMVLSVEGWVQRKRTMMLGGGCRRYSCRLQRLYCRTGESVDYMVLSVESWVRRETTMMLGGRCKR